jgi:hypothetical protein
MSAEQPKPKKRFNKKWLIALAVIGLGASVLWTLRPRPLLLLSQAKRVADTRYWRNDPGAYFWLSDHEIMLFRTWPKDPYEAQRLELRTMQETPLAPLNKVLKNMCDIEWGVDVLPSPDGSVLLMWRSHKPNIFFRSNDSPYLQYASRVNIDGTQLFQWPGHPNGLSISDSTWQADSKGWLHLGTFNKYDGSSLASVKFYSLNAPGRTKEIVLGTNNQFPINAGLAADNTLVGMDLVSFGPGGTARLRIWPLKEGAKPAEKLVPLPGFADNYSTIVSPRGDRIAWVISGTGRKSPTNLLERLFGFLGQKPVPTTGLWVSKVDGSELHEIGRMEFPWKPKGNTLPSAALRPSLVRWMPDGKHLSFIHDEALYTVPVD